MSLGVLPRREPALTRSAADGLLELVAEARADGQTFLSRRRQRFPLRLTTPLYLDPARPGMAFLYVQNPTGGLFEGDDHTISLTARSGALVHLTTQAASKAYRTGQGCARQRVELAVSAGAFVEYVPDPLIPHAGARFHQDLAANVESGGALIVAETVAPGRVAFGEAFQYTSLSLSTRISRDGAEKAVDSVILQPSELDPRRPGILGEYAYLASLFAVGPGGDPEALARSISDALEHGPDCLAATAALPSGSGVLARILARSGIPAQHALQAAWAAARMALLGAPPPPRRK
jgi:urease accessory protein